SDNPLNVTDVSNFHLKRSNFRSIVNISNCQNLLIRNNFIDGSGNPFTISNSTFILENNFMLRTGGGNVITLNAGSTGIVKNNVFGLGRAAINNSIIKNNIFLYNTVGYTSLSGANNNIFNNVFAD